MSNNKLKILEPFWNEPQIEQVIGRAIRYSSHSSPTDITNNDEKINDNKKKISELRNELVDYSDITPNEPRYIKENVLSNEMFYPFGNIYPVGKIPTYFNDIGLIDIDMFKNKIYSDRIINAIKYLQVNALKKYVIKNLKTILLPNPFYILYNTKYPIILNEDVVKQIIEILIENYDDYYNLITSISESNEYINELLYSYLPIEEDNICSICLVTEPKIYLINSCNCVTKTHTNCLIKLNNHKPLDKCAVCLAKYKINEPVYQTKSGLIIKPELMNIFFPHNDLYYGPCISTKKLIKVDGMSRLTFAIMYLQVSRVEELLKEQEILEGLSNYHVNEIYGQHPLISLAHGNMPGNCSINFGDNIVKYKQIFIHLLYTNKIKLTQKDKFNKSLEDYIKEYSNDIFGPIILNYKRYCI